MSLGQDPKESLHEIMYSVYRSVIVVKTLFSMWFVSVRPKHIQQNDGLILVTLPSIVRWNIIVVDKISVKFNVIYIFYTK